MDGCGDREVAFAIPSADIDGDDAAFVCSGSCGCIIFNGNLGPPPNPIMDKLFLGIVLIFGVSSASHAYSCPSLTVGELSLFILVGLDPPPDLPWLMAARTTVRCVLRELNTDLVLRSGVLRGDDGFEGGGGGVEGGEASSPSSHA